MMKQDIPVSLKIVAWLFIISGIFAVIEILASLTNHNLNINLTVINIFAGIGLLKLRSGWRIYSLVVIWFGLIIVPIVLLYVLTTASVLDFTVLGQKVDHLSKTSALAFGVFGYAVTIWEYRVLIRSDVKELFIGKNTTPVYPKVPDDSEPVDLDSFPASWNPYFGSNYFKAGESLNPASTKRKDTEDI